MAKDSIKPILEFLPVLNFCLPLSLGIFLPDFFPALSFLDSIYTLDLFVQTLPADPKMTIKLGWVIDICLPMRLYLACGWTSPN